MRSSNAQRIAVIGSGAAGLSAAWLLSKRHRVTLLEKDDRLGGHANSVCTDDGDAPVIDTGFIVYNEPSYPNLTRWFDTMGIATEKSNMSFSVSRDNGGFEYAGGPPLGLLAQPANLLRPRFYKMLGELLRFYREAPKHAHTGDQLSLGEYLKQGNYSQAFLDDHLMPFAAAIWSASPETLLDYPAAAFIRFCDNHGLLQLTNRPQWRTVTGGSVRYVEEVATAIGSDMVKSQHCVVRVERHSGGVNVQCANGENLAYDQVVIATHANQALEMLATADAQEQALLSAFSYEKNRAILHTDRSFMPKRRSAWCSWNYVESKALHNKVCVSYWMNRLQNLKNSKDYFVTLNPSVEPASRSVIAESDYEHPVFNAAAMTAQRALWQLQGRNRVWFCGSYFGSGFHEDAVQSGFAVAEQLGGEPRPWQLDNASSRIVVDSVVNAAVAPS